MNDLPESLRDPMKVLERGRQIEEGGGLRLEQPSSKQLSSGPWKVAIGVNEAMKNWLVASLGMCRDHGDEVIYVTTDHVHASDAVYYPYEDAEFIVSCRNFALEHGDPLELIDRLQQDLARYRSSHDVSLPEVGGETLPTSLADFVRVCKTHLAEEQAKIRPDNALISTLCNAVRLARENERMAKSGLGQPPNARLAVYPVTFEVMDEIYETLKFYANLCSYQGERIGGVLAGCPRGPEPTPDQLVIHAQTTLQRIDAEVLGRAAVTKEEYPKVGQVRAHKHTCANVQPGSTIDNVCDCGAVETPAPLTEADIVPGREFVWMPDVPSARCRVRVTEVQRHPNGDVDVVAILLDDSVVSKKGYHCRNDMSRFLEACVAAPSENDQ